MVQRLCIHQTRRVWALEHRLRSSRASTAAFTLVLALASAFSWAPAAHAQFFALGKGGAMLEPYDVDYSALADPTRQITLQDKVHYVPFGSGSYVTFDGELRDQGWSQNHASYALRSPTANTYDLQRMVASAYIHFDRHLATFVQLGRFDSFSRVNPSTTERQEGRLQQGFVELKEKADVGAVTLRGGRQEIGLGSGRFVWVNESSNVRTTHDGIRAQAALTNGPTLDVLYTRPVTPTLDPFADFHSHAGAFAAAYLSQAMLQNALHLDAYYLYRRNLGGQYSGLTGNEDRSTLGGKIWGQVANRTGTFLYDGDFAYQFGSFQGRQIAAFGGSARALYTFDHVAWKPGLQLQGSYFSGGGGTTTRTIRTFAAPFPRPTLLNYVGINTLENLIEAYPALVITPTDTLALRFGPEVLWRASVDDAVYVSRATPLTQTATARDKAQFIGTNLIATAQWRATSNITVFAEVLHELPGPAITLAGGHSVDAGVIQVGFTF